MFPFAYIGTTLLIITSFVLFINDNLLLDYVLHKFRPAAQILFRKNLLSKKCETKNLGALKRLVKNDIIITAYTYIQTLQEAAMQTIEILDIKSFMQLLFQSSPFDRYEFVSAIIRTDMTYNLDGHMNMVFFTKEEASELHAENSPYLFWEHVKDKLFYLIKGNKTPSELKIVLKLPAEHTISFLNAANSTLNAADIDGMFLNILFQEERLTLVCGISYRIFTLDKSLENEFSDKIIGFLKSQSITCQ